MSLIAAIGKAPPAEEEVEAPPPAEPPASGDPSALITDIEAKLAELRAALGDMGA